MKEKKRNCVWWRVRPLRISDNDDSDRNYEIKQGPKKFIGKYKEQYGLNIQDQDTEALGKKIE